MKYVISVDIGTTTIRACLYDHKCKLLASSEEKVNVELTGHENLELRVEIEPDGLFEQFKRVVETILSNVTLRDDVSMAFCCQRNSFICWDKTNLKTLSKIVCWNDSRARKACQSWNNSYTVKGLNLAGTVLHAVTRQPRFLAARVLQFLSAMVSHRLMVTIEQSKELKRLLEVDQLGFGCLETWLILRLTMGRTIVAEASNASSTGMFDPFINDYNHTILKIIGFPQQVLPPLVDSASDAPIATINRVHFGREIPIWAVLADQQSALYGTGGFRKGDIKISLGTGTFVDLNSGKKPHASMKGLYPLVGWRVNGRPTFVAEGNDHDTAVLLRWAQSIGLFADVSETSALAASVESTHGVVFIPAFGGLQTPINDDSACCAFLGLRPDTSKAHMVRAILESIAFRVYQIFITIKSEVALSSNSRIRICGGVSANDLICQCVADMIETPIERISQPGYAASKGAALLAGLVQNWWTEADMLDMVEVDRVFKPSPESRKRLQMSYKRWLLAVQRCTNFQ